MLKREQFLPKEMKMKNYLLVFLTVVMISGCVSQKNAPEPLSGSQQMTERGAMMLEAFKKGDYPLFASQFDGNIPDNFGEKEFNTGRTQVSLAAGNITGYRFLGTLSGPVFTTWLWAVTFDKKGADKKDISQELLFKAVAGKLDGKMQIVSFGFLL